jgi:CheY-like chemotaxis protein
VLEVSRIVTGKLRLTMRPVDLNAVIKSAAETVRPAAEAKGVHLQPDLSTSFTALVSGDPDRLQQVVWNLLANAIKFTPRGGWVRVRLEPVDSSVRIFVQDSGQGIDPLFLPYVFDRFRQADASAARAHGGLGLGLAIVRHLVELHGGTVEAESLGKDRGATFVVQLPRAGVFDAATTPARPPSRPDLPEATRDEPDRPALSLEGIRVLVVEDHVDTLEIVVMVLRDHGAEVVTAQSTEEARKVFQQTRPHVLLSDIGLPGEDGYSLIRSIRELPEELGGTVPAAALTAYAGQTDRTRILEAGFQAHVAKPVEPEELIATVARLGAPG